MSTPLAERPIAGALSVVAYLGCSVLGLLPIGLFTAMLIAIDAVLSGEDPSALLAGGSPELSGGILFASMLAQFGGMLLLAVVLARAFKRPLAPALGLAPFPVSAALVAAFFTPTAGMLTARVSEWMVEHELTFGTLETLGDAVSSGGLLDRALMGAAILLLAPLVEELVFRGFFWDALSRVLPNWGVWLATSLLFAGYHTDPAHVVGVLGLSLYAGWTRWRTGSVWPAVAVHFVNNALAWSMATFGDEAPLDSVPWPAATVGAVVAIAAGAGVWALARRAAPQGAAEAR